MNCVTLKKWLGYWWALNTVNVIYYCMLSLVLLFDYSFWIHYMPIWSYRIRNIIYEKDVSVIQFSCYSFSLCFANCVIKNELHYWCVMRIAFTVVVRNCNGHLRQNCNERNRKCEIVQLQSGSGSASVGTGPWTGRVFGLGWSQCHMFRLSS